MHLISKAILALVATVYVVSAQNMTDQEIVQAVSALLTDIDNSLDSLNATIIFEPTTQSPASTAGPTAGPTAAPTASPATRRTFFPPRTAGPTAGPTDGPTASPTAGPTAAPTAGPTAAPTASTRRTFRPPDASTLIPQPVQGDSMIQAYKGRQLLSVDECGLVAQCRLLYTAVAVTTNVTNEIVSGNINETQVTTVNRSALVIQYVAENPSGQLLTLMQNTPTVLQDLVDEASNNTDEVQAYYSANWSDNGGGLSAGAIVGIVIGVLALLGIIAGITYYCLEEKKKKKHLKSENF